MGRQTTSKWLVVLAVFAAGAGLGVNYWISRVDKPAASPAPTATPTTTKNPHSSTAVATPGGATQKPVARQREMNLIQKIKAGQKPRRPDFAIQDLDGKVRHIREWDKKKVIVLNFWATWCPPCKKEMPAFMELQEKYGKQGLQIIGIAIDDKKLVKEFVDDMGINYVILSGQLDAVDISRRYGNFRGQLPYTVFINSKQQLVAVKRGEITKAEAEKAILQLLKTSATHR